MGKINRWASDNAGGLPIRCSELGADFNLDGLIAGFKPAGAVDECLIGVLSQKNRLPYRLRQ